MKRAWIFCAAIVVLIAAVFVAKARVHTHYRAGASTHLVVTVDSIDFREDLTRLYGKFVGAPHTSQKVESITLATPEGSFTANDIDGVDFSRWFQWEEEGVIPVEVDFAAMKQVPAGSKLTVVTARGTDVIAINPGK